MRSTCLKALVAAASLAVLAGCQFLEGGVTLTGTYAAWYFDITGDVTVTLSSGGTPVSVEVPVTYGDSVQVGAYLVPDVPPGTYAVTVTFQNSYDYTGYTHYSLDGGDTWTPVDAEAVTGAAAPYTYTITIDSIDMAGDTKLDIETSD